MWLKELPGFVSLHTQPGSDGWKNQLELQSHSPRPSVCLEVLMPRKVAAGRAAWEKSDPWDKLVSEGQRKGFQGRMELQDPRFVPLGEELALAVG